MAHLVMMTRTLFVLKSRGELSSNIFCSLEAIISASFDKKDVNENFEQGINCLIKEKTDFWNHLTEIDHFIYSPRIEKILARAANVPPTPCSITDEKHQMRWRLSFKFSPSLLCTQMH